jgi:hypothetical protein
MRRLSACLTLLACTALAAQEKPGKPDKSDKAEKSEKAEVKWEKFTPKGAKAQVSFPGKATETPTSSGGYLLLAGPDAKGIYQMSYSNLGAAVNLDDKAAVKKVLDGARDGGVKSLKGKLLTEKDITLGKYPGRAFEMKSETYGLYRTRVYLSKTKLYQVTVFGTKEFVDSDEAKKFLDSLKILE